MIEFLLKLFHLNSNDPEIYIIKEQDDIDYNNISLQELMNTTLYKVDDDVILE